jgi:hypothetical protein
VKDFLVGVAATVIFAVGVFALVAVLDVVLRWLP